MAFLFASSRFPNRSRPRPLVSGLVIEKAADRHPPTRRHAVSYLQPSIKPKRRPLCKGRRSAIWSCEFCGLWGCDGHLV
jgi:hypothetical protein